MKKNMIIFISIILVLFIALAFVVNYQNNNDPLYQNQISLDDLSDTLNNEEDVTVYFYSPTCEHCKVTTPVVVPLTEDLGIDMKKVNVLEYDAAWAQYDIEGTPTIIHFEDGEEAARISGSQPEASFRSFFEDEVLN
ncbi:thioredoxin family protein [Radiobacillus sp. PE A8.2]|uniref:thioredoxin family protein n=1 Tax=Radiobacillus sp. PE A8.2 TaxID=3380349 RepID=UPI00388DAFB2